MCWFSYLLGLTFPGILAASTERQFTQEAMTSTGGLITDVNLEEEEELVSHFKSSCPTVRKQMNV